MDQSLDEVKQELARVLFPLFVCLFLNMVLKGLQSDAVKFLTTHKEEFLPTHRADILTLETVTDI